VLRDQGLARLRAIDPETLPIAEDFYAWACVGRVGKFVCVGLNYAYYAAEAPSFPRMASSVEMCSSRSWRMNWTRRGSFAYVIRVGGAEDVAFHRTTAQAAAGNSANARGAFRRTLFLILIGC
jgi:hypothetical protein